MANVFEFPLLCPLKPLQLSDKLSVTASGDILYSFNPSFNDRDFDADFFGRTLRSYEDSSGYFQPFQQCDTITQCWMGSDSSLANYQYASLLKQDGSLYSNKTITVQTDATNYGGMFLYWISIDLWDVPEGKYFIQIRHNDGSGSYLPIIFEPFHLKQIHANTIAIDYNNSRNAQGIIYPSSGFTFRLRVKGHVMTYEPKAKMNGYENQTMNYEILSGLPYREYPVIYRQVPKWLADKINRIHICNNVKYDNKQLSRPADSELKPDGSGVPLQDYTINLREQVMTDSLDAAHTIQVVGNMPQTKYFWIERITIDGNLVNIRKGFRGKRNFLDYLNSNKTNGILAGAYWAEDPRNKLVLMNTVVTASIADVDILMYGIRLVIPSSGTLTMTFYKGAIGSTVYYAVQYGDGTASVNKTAYTGSPTPSKAYSSTAWKEHFLYFSDCEELDISNAIAIESIGGDLPPSFKDLRVNLTGSSLRSMENNMFRFVSTNGMTMVWLQNQNITTYAMDEIIRFLYDSINNLNSSCTLSLNSQSPAGPPTKSDPGMGFILSKLKAKVSSLSTD